MAIIGQVEKHSWKVKLLNISIHVLLILGSATMVYPLLLMVSGSLKSNVDFANFTLIPQYLSQDLELFKKHVNTKYNNKPNVGYRSYKEPRTTTDTAAPPERINKAMMDDYAEYLEGIRKNKPHYWRTIAMSFEQGVDTLAVRKYREWLQTRPEFGEGEEGIARFNKMHGTEYTSWSDIYLGDENFFTRRAVTNYDTGYLKYLKDFKNEVCTDHLLVNWLDIEGNYIEFLRRKVDQDLEDINKILHTDFNSWAEVVLPETVPTKNPRLAQQWSGFVKTEVNPAFIRLDTEKASDAWHIYLLKKYGSLDNIKKIYGAAAQQWKAIGDIPLTAEVPEQGVMRTDWLDFLYQDSTASSLWTDFIKKKYQTLARLNAAWGVKYRSFNEIPAVDEFAPIPDTLPAQAKKDFEALKLEIAERRKAEVPADAITVETLANEYRKYLTAKFGTTQKMDEAYENGFKDFSDALLSEFAPGENNLQASRDWNEFVRGLPKEKISLSRQASAAYKKWLAARYTKNGVCDFKVMSDDYKMNISDLNTVPSFNTYPAHSIRYTDKARQDYVAAIASGEFAKLYRVNEPQAFQKDWEAFLKRKYQTVEKLNESWKLTHKDFASIALPSKMFDWYQMVVNRSAIIKEYLKRNYLMVFDTLIMNGNAALNTVIYCFLAVLAALIVNPLCAYGLSRYKPAASYKILLFLLLPMAFPGMVLAIPQFLLIKEFGLLNTFACLILPGMAQGYSIFLLKGFFDSLPKELFESAALDGANEWIVFWNIGMSLSTPILSVIALGAFTHAYANFMLAFLMCQKQSMWTMMVYLYQLQQRASSSVGFAALIIAAIPTLIVFIFCQNIIIRGIVVPTEK